MIKWILKWFLRVLSAFGKPKLSVTRELTPLEQQQKAYRIKLSGYRDQWAKNYEDWSKPENIAARKKEHEEAAPKALEAGKKLSKQVRESLGLPLEDPPLPDPLPKHMIGQSESTIKAMLRHEDWEYDATLCQWSKK